MYDELVTQLKEWMGPFLAPKARFETYGDGEWHRVRIATRWADYTIAFLHGDKSMLMANASVRVVRPGEDWLRGNDLPDGPFTKEIWDSIVMAIVTYEAVEVPDPVESLAVPVA